MRIPRQRLLHPNDWDANVASMHPFVQPEEPLIFLDAGKFVEKQQEQGGNHNEDVNDNARSNNNAATPKNIIRLLDCPICFQDALLVCGQCRCVYYCSKPCQKMHWKQSHKKACRPNPKPYKINLDLTPFQSLPDSCFEGHEFLVIQPIPAGGGSGGGETMKPLSSLQDICDKVLEPADDLLDLPGFQDYHLSSSYLLENQKDPIFQKMVKRFGWTSKRMGLELVNGYRIVEDRLVFMVFCDDSFQSETRMAPSYYGDALFSGLPSGKHVRGNLVIFKLSIRKKRRNSATTSNMDPALQMLMAMTVDAGLEYEYVLYPINKVEIAHLLTERMKAKEQEAYTDRTWRDKLRTMERQIELSSSFG